MSMEKMASNRGSGGWAMNSEEPVAEPGQLYDIEQDPGETTNLYNNHADIAHELKALPEKQKLQGFTRPAFRCGCARPVSRLSS
jgi:arylsulfatase A